MLNQIDLSRLDLNLLVLFSVVMEERHVGRSAERLNLSPSAVSHGLGRLRTMLGDPLFLRTPKGVIPTERAEALAGPVADILDRVRGVVASAVPFDPAGSDRRFVIAAPDGVSAVFLPPLLDRLARVAPSVAISLRQLLPREGDPNPETAWRDALSDLEARGHDIAVIPQAVVPRRFTARRLYEEDFVLGLRAGHPFAAAPDLRAYCRLRHLVVSHTGDAYGFVDGVLAGHGLARRVALTVPNFLFALDVLSRSDMVAALPRRFMAAQAARFGVVAAEAPVPLGRFSLTAVVPDAAMKDAGIAWLVAALEAAAAEAA